VGDPTAFRLGFAWGPSPARAAPDPILTPCIGICTLDDAGYCEGCRRTGDEIAAWSSMTAAEREHLMNDVLPRREAGSA
jgi:predicted Fe-S protein YdhL (DUF1289 family)